MRLLARLHFKLRYRNVFIAAVILISLATIAGAYFYNLVKKSPQLAAEVAGTSDAKPKYVTLEIFIGNVDIKTRSSNTFSPAKDGQEVLEGSTIKTDSTGRAQILYPNGSATRIDYNSEMTLADYQVTPFNTTVDLTSGRIWSRVAKLFGVEYYQTKSPSAIAAVRGTSFGHSLLTNFDNKLMVTKGTILSDCLNKNQTSEITQDQKGILDCSKNPPKLGTLDDSDKDEWYWFNQTQDSILDKLYGEGTFSDLSQLLGTQSSLALLPKLQFDTKLQLYYFSPTLKTFGYDLTTYFLGTPSPTPTPLAIDLKTKIINTPTPTPSTNTTNSNTSNNVSPASTPSSTPSPTAIPVYTRATPTPSPTPSTFNISPFLFNSQIYLPTPTPTPVILY